MNKKKYLGIIEPRETLYLWIILTLIIIIGILKFYIALPALFFYILILMYYFRTNFKRKKEITRYLENLSLNINSATKDTLLNFPLPLVVCEISGEIIWYNSQIKKILENDNGIDKSFESVINSIKPENILNKNESISKQIDINNREFNVVGNFVKNDNKGGYILVLYFIENTELIQLKKKFHEEKSSVGIIVIDNYDDLMQSMDDGKRPQMLAEIDSYLINWTQLSKGILKKFERDRYLFIFENKYLKEFEEKKFEILDTVKEIKIGNKIPVTLSIGMGVNGESLYENFNFATASIDIAFGRGGDQVVLKNAEEINFYGGKSRELEKRTKVKARVIAFALRELIDQSQSIMIMGHENPDTDVLGSALGIYRIAKSRGKKVNIILNASNPAIDSFINKIVKNSEYDDVFLRKTEAMSVIDRKTLLIIVDTHRASYTECPDLLDIADNVVVIDHHRRGADFIQDTALTYQEPYASSTCELITEIIQYVDEDIKLSAEEVEALYAGIIVDTKHFTFKTGVRTFEAAAYLRRQGVDTVQVRQLLQNNLETYISISNIVRNAVVLNENIAISVFKDASKSDIIIAAQAADQMLNLSCIDAAFVICEIGNTVSISGRSVGNINVQVILEKLGGGGHMTIAGAQITNSTVDDAVLMLKKAINDYINEINKEQQN